MVEAKPIGRRIKIKPQKWCTSALKLLITIETYAVIHINM